jgi:hypothetical protein
LHVLFNLPTTLLPELALKAFEASHYRLPMPFLSSLTILSPFNTLTTHQRGVLLQQYLPWAASAAAECKPLIGVYWEKRWAMPVDELRAEFGARLPGPGWEGQAFRRGTKKEREEKRRLKEQALAEEAAVQEAAARVEAQVRIGVSLALFTKMRALTDSLDRCRTFTSSESDLMDCFGRVAWRATRSLVDSGQSETSYGQTRKGRGRALREQLTAIHKFANLIAGTDELGRGGVSFWG